MATENSAATGLASRVKSWAARPFTEEMDLLHWVALAVLLSTVVFMWLKILSVIQDANS